MRETRPLPVPAPAPPVPSVLDLVTTSKQLRDALNTYASEKRVGQLDGRSHVKLDSTIAIAQANNDGTPWGVVGNYCQIDWAGPGGDDMLRFEGVSGVNNRGLTLEKLSLYGNGYDAAPASSCIKLSAPLGDVGCIYKMTLRDIFTSYAEYGFILEGAVFEGLGENLHAENHRRDGMMMRHFNVGQGNQAIVSNIMLMAPNMSRNLGAGIRCTNSTNILLGSFVLNAEGGVVAPDGLRACIASNGENTGESLFVVPTPGWGSLILGNEASTDGVTHARKYEGGQWVSVGKPMLYLLDDGHSGVSQAYNAVAAYGADADKTAVVKP